MADVTLQGLTVPSQPDSRLAIFDTNYWPQQVALLAGAHPDISTVITDAAEAMAYADRGSGPSAPAPVRVLAITGNGSADLRVTLDAPLLLDPATETHSGQGKWEFTTPTVLNTAATGTLIQGIVRFLRRISKLNRGVN